MGAIRSNVPHILEIDHHAESGQNCGHDNRDNAGAFDIDTGIPCNIHILPYSTHVLSELCFTKPDDEQAQKKDDQECQHRNLDAIYINGKECQAYIIPIRQDSDNGVIGALMVSHSIDDFNNIIKNYILTTLATAFAVLAAAFLFIRWYVDRFAQEFYEATDKSKRDLLTGLFNKRSFEEEVQTTINEQKPEDVSVLIIFDFDNFKHVNDHYGHQIGDEVLKAFGLILVRAFRTKDLIGRIGGDEFMVFMPDMTENFLQRADEISREILHELDILKVGPASHFSCSIGIGTDATGYDFKKLYKLADKALYESKRRGKACYVRFSSEDKD